MQEWACLLHPLGFWHCHKGHSLCHTFFQRWNGMKRAHRFLRGRTWTLAATTSVVQRLVVVHKPQNVHWIRLDLGNYFLSISWKTFFIEQYPIISQLYSIMEFQLYSDKRKKNVGVSLSKASSMAPPPPSFYPDPSCVFMLRRRLAACHPSVSMDWLKDFFRGNPLDFPSNQSIDSQCQI